MKRVPTKTRSEVDRLWDGDITWEEFNRWGRKPKQATHFSDGFMFGYNDIKASLNFRREGAVIYYR